MGYDSQGCLPGVQRLAGSCEEHSDDRDSGPSGGVSPRDPQTKLALLWVPFAMCILEHSAYNDICNPLEGEFWMYWALTHPCPSMHAQAGRESFTCKAVHAQRLQVLKVTREDDVLW